MSHFAELDENNVVLRVIVAEQDYIDTIEGTWVQTSYNTYAGRHYNPETLEEDDGVPLRKNYAGVGFIYDPDRDAFIPPKPYESFVLDEDTCRWEPPIPDPVLTPEQQAGDFTYIWDEEAYQADNTKGWVIVDMSYE